MNRYINLKNQTCLMTIYTTNGNHTAYTTIISVYEDFVLPVGHSVSFNFRASSI